MARKTMLTGIVLLTILLSQAVFADDSLVKDCSTRPASNKLWRGFVNSLTGIGEIIRQPIVHTQKDGVLPGLPVGIINGVVMSFVRTGVGVAEVFTFPVPFDEDIGYGSVLNPAYVWQKAD